MKNGTTLLVLAALCGVVIAMVHVSKLETRLLALEKGGAASAAAAAPAQPVEVAVHMARIQVYMHKLYWAGMAQNVALADFYRHEIKEVMEEVVKAGVKEDGVDISAMMSATGIQAIDAMKAHLKEKGLDGFRQQYDSLLEGCNSCHAASGHAMVRIQVPTENRYSDQVFTP
jgi:hypothetical protein